MFWSFCLHSFNRLNCYLCELARQPTNSHNIEHHTLTLSTGFGCYDCWRLYSCLVSVTYHFGVCLESYTGSIRNSWLSQYALNWDIILGHIYRGLDVTLLWRKYEVSHKIVHPSQSTRPSSRALPRKVDFPFIVSFGDMDTTLLRYRLLTSRAITSLLCTDNVI